MSETMSLRPWLDYVEQLSPYRDRDGVPSPHQPVLLLAWVRHRVMSGEDALPFVQAQTVLKQALPMLSDSEGVAGKTQQPFTVFVDSGCWELKCHGSPTRDPSGIFHATPLKDGNASIRPDASLRTSWASSPAKAPSLVIRAVLETFFPPRTWQHVIDAVELPLGPSSEPTPLSRSPRSEDITELRRAVLAEREACEACMASAPGVLEIAHPKWLTHGGALTRGNTWLLCRTHATAVDLGLLGVRDSQWAASPRLGLPLRRPTPQESDSTRWHRNHVLRREASHVSRSG